MTDGTRAALELALAADDAELGDQFDMIEALGLPVPLAGSRAAQVVAARRGPGRPAGSRNRRTEQTVAMLLGRHQDPRSVLLGIAETPVDVLVATLGCSPIEALAEKRMAATAVLPYVAAKLPLAVDIRNHKVVELHIYDGAEGDGEPSGGLAAAIIESMEYQEVSGEAGRQSNGRQSNGAAEGGET